MSPESATARVARLLTMVPWLLQHQGVSLESAAREFDLSVPQLTADLELLFVCGTPGGMPDDLIEAEWESGSVFLGNADAIARPLRLGLDEALMLTVALRAIAATPQLGERDVVDRALAKLTSAIGTQDRALADSAARRIQVEVADDHDVAALDGAQDALRRHRRVHLRYVNANRDETTQRDVDPMRMLAQDGHVYLEGWCHRAHGVRLFRLDRVAELVVLDQDGTPPPQARSRDLDTEMFQPATTDTAAVISLDPSARWVADYYPHESARELPDGSMLVELYVADPGWLRRLLWRLGGSARVVEPTWLAEQVRDGAHAALAAYDDARLDLGPQDSVRDQ